MEKLFSSKTSASLTAFLHHKLAKLSFFSKVLLTVLEWKIHLTVALATLSALMLSCSSENKSNQNASQEPKSQIELAVKQSLPIAGGGKQPGANYSWVPMWIRDSNLTVPRISPAVVAANGYIYVLGGGNESDKIKSIYSSVEFTRIQRDGSLGPWKITASMNTKRVFAAAIEVDGYIYVLGGEKGYTGTDDLLNTVERAKILPDGSLGPWKLEKNSMNSNRRALVASYYNGWIYAFGGYNGIFLKNMERTRINPDGSLQKWIHEPEEAKNERYIHSGVIYKNNVYLFGGHETSPERGTDTAERASINSNGEIGVWSNLPLMPTKRFGGDAAVVHNTVFVIGGQNTIPLSSIDKAPIFSDSNIGQWTQDTPLPSSRVGAALAVWNDTLYVIGGYDSKGKYLQETLRAYHLPGKSLGVWTNDLDLIAVKNSIKNRPPKDAENHFSKGIQRFNESRYDEAITELQLGLKIEQKFAPEPRNLLGLAFHAKKQHKKAVDQFKGIILLSPEFIPAYLNLADVYYEMGLVKESENLYRVSIKLKPDFIKAKIKLLQLLVESNRCAEAKPELNLLSSTNSNDEIIQALKKKCETDSE